MIKKTIVIFVFIATGALTAAAQSLSPTVISSSGGSGSSNGISLIWTTGELMTQIFSADTLLLTQGFQQGKITVSSTAINEMKGLNMNVNVYPNPVQNQLSIDFQDMADKTASLKLMSLSGKTLQTRKLNNPSGISRLNLNGLPKGAYLLEIRVQNRRKTFKIVKQ